MVPMKGKGCLYYYYQTRKLHSGHEELLTLCVCEGLACGSLSVKQTNLLDLLLLY